MAERNVVNVFISFHTLAAIFPSNAKRSSEKLPFLTIDGFEEIAAGFRNVSKASLVHYSPLLRTEAELHQWNNYSVSHAHWISEGRRNQNYGEANVSDQFVPFVFAFQGTTILPISGAAPYIPAWQMSPVPPKVQLVNFDGSKYPVTNASMAYALESGGPSLTEPIPELRNFFEVPVEGPISLLHEPVYSETQGESGRVVVGFLTGLLAWKTFFDNVLPSGQDRIIVVVESGSFKSTFQIDGPVATFLSDGDSHNPEYDQMKKSQSFVSGTGEETSVVKRQCNHIVHVYPTKALENNYKTKAPALYAMFILLIFLFAALVFIAYDYFVTSRQHRTEQEASKTSAIVQELFPGDVANRLFGSHEGGADDGPMPMSKPGFTRVDRDTIAELHPNATVLCKSLKSLFDYPHSRQSHS
jgi:CHASE domain